MKKILITGANSYIGTSLEKWLGQYHDKYFINTIDVKGNEWREKDYSEYDIVFHVAGIAHVSSNPGMEELYYKVNRDLTIEVAKKAKSDGVNQFIFMSSIIVYGNSKNSKVIIDENTVPAPSNFYGLSKLQAEEGIKPLEDKKFKVVILRPPMIYGKDSKGNYPKLAKMAKKFPVFPDIDNQRSMLHIDNLCEFIRLIIENEESGTFYPQNAEYVKTSQMVKLIAEVHGNNINMVRLFNPFLSLLKSRCELIYKVFGNLVYKKSMSEYKEDYRVNDLRTSIQKTEV